MKVLAVAVLCLPLAAGILALIAARFCRPIVSRLVGAVGAAITALCALWLLISGAGGSPLALEWLPGSGTMAIVLGRPGLVIVLAMTLAGFLTLIASAFAQDVHRPLAIAALLAGMSAANVALLADHFLARYVALELVVLAFAATTAIEGGGNQRVQTAWRDYLVLRVGDAFLLAAIFILAGASDTLSIGPSFDHAIEALAGDGQRPLGTHLGWAIAALALAAWVKLGGWPFHVWSLSGKRVSLGSHVWLVATLVPTLGGYLLYRVAPMIAHVAPVRTGSLWIGALSAIGGPLLALAQPSARAALAYIGAGQAGILLAVAASGAGPAVFVGILALVPIRPLLVLTEDAARGGTDVGRRIGASLFALGGAALAALDLLTIGWARASGAPLAVVAVLQVAVALIAVWIIAGAHRLSRDRQRSGSDVALRWTRLLVPGLLGAVVLVGGLRFGALVRSLTQAGLVEGPTSPSPGALLLEAAAAPALLISAVLGMAAWAILRRQAWDAESESASDSRRPLLQQGLLGAARALHALVEVGIVDGTASLIAHGAIRGSRAAWQVEHRGLDRLARSAAQALVEGARLAHQSVEEDSLEGLLRAAVRAARGLARALQRGHTGRLRRNLVWVPIALALAAVGLAVLGQ